MIKLKDILTEARFDIGYHAAPGKVMGSINKHGLNPKLSKYYDSDEIYFFRDNKLAKEIGFDNNVIIASYRDDCTLFLVHNRCITID